MFRNAPRLLSRAIGYSSSISRGRAMSDLPAASTVDSEFVEAWKKVTPNIEPPKTPLSFMKPRPPTPSSIPSKITVNFVLPYQSELSTKEIVFVNSDVGRALSLKENSISAARYLFFFSFGLCHRLPRGSCIGINGEAIFFPPSPWVSMNTCGAGDAYASEILYSILRGTSDLKGIGMLASEVAAFVDGQHGMRPRVQDAVDLAESLAFQLESSKHIPMLGLITCPACDLTC